MAWVGGEWKLLSKLSQCRSPHVPQWWAPRGSRGKHQAACDCGGAGLTLTWVQNNGGWERGEGAQTKGCRQIPTSEDHQEEQGWGVGQWAPLPTAREGGGETTGGVALGPSRQVDRASKPGTCFLQAPLFFWSALFSFSSFSLVSITQGYSIHIPQTHICTYCVPGPAGISRVTNKSLAHMKTHTQSPTTLRQFHFVFGGGGVSCNSRKHR